EDDGFRLDTPVGDVGGAGQPLGRVTVQPRVGHPGPDAVPQAVPQGRHPSPLLVHVAGADLGGLAEPDDARHVLGAGPAPALVLAAVLDGHHLRPPADPQARDALGAVDLVAGERQQVDVGEVEIDLAERLHGVDVERHAGGVRDGADGRDGLDGADLAVGVHDRDADRVGPDRALHVVGIHHAGAVDADIGHREALALQPLAGPEHRVVLDLGGDEV